MKIPEARTAVNKEWHKLKSLPAWDEKKAKPKDAVVHGAKKDGKTIHFANFGDFLSFEEPKLVSMQHDGETNKEVHLQQAGTVLGGLSQLGEGIDVMVFCFSVVFFCSKCTAKTEPTAGSDNTTTPQNLVLNTSQSSSHFSISTCLYCILMRSLVCSSNMAVVDTLSLFCKLTFCLQISSWRNYSAIIQSLEVITSIRIAFADFFSLNSGLFHQTWKEKS